MPDGRGYGSLQDRRKIGPIGNSDGERLESSENLELLLRQLNPALQPGFPESRGNFLQWGKV